VESRSNVNGPAGSTGPAPAAHNRASSHDPIVDGARSWSNTSLVAPEPSSATSSIESPPVSIDPTTDNAFVPLFAPCRARRTRCSTSPASPTFCANAAAGNSPATDTRFASSQLTDTRDKSCDALTDQDALLRASDVTMDSHIVATQVDSAPSPARGSTDRSPAEKSGYALVALMIVENRSSHELDERRDRLCEHAAAC